MGLTEDDVKAASKAEGIGHVEGRYSVDALWQTVIIKSLFMSCLCFRR